jgi:hypothetical protein
MGIQSCCCAVPTAYALLLPLQQAKLAIDPLYRACLTSYEPKQGAEALQKVRNPSHLRSLCCSRSSIAFAPSFVRSRSARNVPFRTARSRIRSSSPLPRTRSRARSSIPAGCFSNQSGCFFARFLSHSRLDRSKNRPFSSPIVQSRIRDHSDYTRLLSYSGGRSSASTTPIQTTPTLEITPSRLVLLATTRSSTARCLETPTHKLSIPSRPCARFH